MAYFFDGAVIMILIVTALTGYCKGFVRYVITMLGTVAAVLVAFLIANMSAENVYNALWHDSIWYPFPARSPDICFLFLHF